jgi:hypothetical protein
VVVADQPTTQPSPASPAQKPAEEADKDIQISPELRERAQAQLGKEEKLIWLGRPAGEIVFRRALMNSLPPTIIVALPCTFFFLLPFFLGAWGALPFLLPFGVVAGAAGWFGYYWPTSRRKKAGEVCYVLTNQRVFTITLKGKTLVAYQPHQLRWMYTRRSVLLPGSDVVFENIQYRQGGGGASRFEKVFGFLALRKGEEVEALIRSTLPIPPGRR